MKTSPTPPEPDLLRLPDGRRLHNVKGWPPLAEAWLREVVEREYGGLPPPPAGIEVETLCRSGVRAMPVPTELTSFRLRITGGAVPFTFCLRLWRPTEAERCPAVVNADGCWGYLTEAVLTRFLSAGYAVLSFNRTELAADLGGLTEFDLHTRRGGIYEVYPEQPRFGALSAWAWGIHRAVDLLRQLPVIDADRIAVTGHSRGGKAALLAGATDARIAAVNDNASGAGGGALYRHLGEGAEPLAHLMTRFPSWFGTEFRDPEIDPASLPFDQHALCAAVAPRLLLHTYAREDAWSNPDGLLACARAVREVYGLYAQTDRLQIHLREGTHAHHPQDWETLLDFLEWQWWGRPSTQTYETINDGREDG